MSGGAGKGEKLRRGLGEEAVKGRWPRMRRKRVRKGGREEGEKR